MTSKNKIEKIIFNKTDLISLIKKIETVKSFAFDIKTNNCNIFNNKIIGITFVIEHNKGNYIPLNHDYHDAPTQLKINNIVNIINPIFANKNIEKICQNLKFNKNILIEHGIKLNNSVYDVILESYVLNNITLLGQYNIYNIAKTYLSYNITYYKNKITSKKNKNIIFNQITIEKAAKYAIEDANLIFLIHKTLWPKIKNIATLKFIFQKIEMPLTLLLCDMERIGVLINKPKLIKQSKYLEKKLIKIKKKAYVNAHEAFNLSSAKQLQNILFNKFKLPILKKTPNGLPSTDENVLNKLIHLHKLPKIILNYRLFYNLKNNFIDKILSMINPLTKRIHTTYNQTTTITGRISSSNPNLQNIPIKTKESRKIRKTFIARKNYKILAADYSQIELRIIAHLSKDKKLIEYFNNNYDIHKITAAEIFNEKLNNITPEQRRKAKTINFGLIYGLSAYGLSNQLKIDITQAQKYITLYFKKYSGIFNYINTIQHEVKQNGYITTIIGRKLYLPNNNLKKYMSKYKTPPIREAINFIIQGSAADIIKIAMVSIAKLINNTKPDIFLLLQIHDELVFEIKNDKIIFFKEKIKKLMENSAKLIVPLKVNINIGNNWDKIY